MKKGYDQKFYRGSIVKRFLGRKAYMSFVEKYNLHKNHTARNLPSRVVLSRGFDFEGVVPRGVLYVMYTVTMFLFIVVFLLILLGIAGHAEQEACIVAAQC